MAAASLTKVMATRCGEINLLNFDVRGTGVTMSATIIMIPIHVDAIIKTDEFGISLFITKTNPPCISLFVIETNELRFINITWFTLLFAITVRFIVGFYVLVIIG